MVDAGDAETGATVIGKGLMECEIAGEPPAIALTLVRAVGDLSRNDLATRSLRPRRAAGRDRRGRSASAVTGSRIAPSSRHGPRAGTGRPARQRPRAQHSQPRVVTARRP